MSSCQQFFKKYTQRDLEMLFWTHFAEKCNYFKEFNIIKLNILVKKLHNSASIRWSMPGKNINKIAKIVYGDRWKNGYKFALWNCGRGLLNEDLSVKLIEIKQFIEAKRPHCFGIVESDLFGLNYDQNRKKFTTSVIREQLGINGYKLELPTSWDTYGQARIICYVSENIKYSRKYLNDGNDHIPTITLEVGQGKASQTVVHYYYREWKNGVTGESDSTCQLEQLKQHISQWESLIRTGKKFIALGDANVCAMHWNEPNFRHKMLSNEIQTFLLQESCFQLVKNYTRVQSVAGTMTYSCLDHVTTNIPEKCSIPEVFTTQSSDHMPVLVTQYSREPRIQPNSIKKRVYRNFSPTDFLIELYDCVVNGGFESSQ